MPEEQVEKKTTNEEIKPTDDKTDKISKLYLIMIGVSFFITLGSAFFIFYLKKIYQKPVISNQFLEDKVIKEAEGYPEFIEYKLEPLTVNLKKTNVDNYVNCKFTLIAVDYETKGELDKKVDVIRDKIIEILSNKTAIELVSVQGKLFLKDQIVTDVNAILKKGSVKEVYLENFVIQWRYI